MSRRAFRSSLRPAARLLGSTLALVALTWAAGVTAQSEKRPSARSAAPIVAVPFYTPVHFMRGMHEHRTAPLDLPVRNPG